MMVHIRVRDCIKENQYILAIIHANKNTHTLIQNGGWKERKKKEKENKKEEIKMQILLA